MQTTLFSMQTTLFSMQTDWPEQIVKTKINRWTKMISVFHPYWSLYFDALFFWCCCFLMFFFFFFFFLLNAALSIEQRYQWQLSFLKHFIYGVQWQKYFRRSEQTYAGCIRISILHKSIAGRYRPIRVAEGAITARFRFIENARWGKGFHFLIILITRVAIVSDNTFEKYWFQYIKDIKFYCISGYRFVQLRHVRVICLGYMYEQHKPMLVFAHE